MARLCSLLTTLLSLINLPSNSVTLIRYSRDVKARNQTLSLYEPVLRELKTAVNKTVLMGNLISLLDCDFYLQTEHGRFELTVDKERGEVYVKLVCDDRYKSTTADRFLCLNGTWQDYSELVRCELVTCPGVQAPANGHVTAENVTQTVDTSLHFWCSDGYKLVGVWQTQCLNTGIWDNLPPRCEIVTCPALKSPAHGYVVPATEVPYKSSAVFACYSSYNIVGNWTLNCLVDGRWSGAAPICAKKCTIPDKKGLYKTLWEWPSLNLLTQTAVIRYGQRVLYTCLKGYTQKYAALSLCMNGVWSPPIDCVKTLLCPPMDISNGVLTFSHNYSAVEYSCNIGYELFGNKVRRCMSNGSWDGEAPLCRKMCPIRKSNGVRDIWLLPDFKRLRPGDYLPRNLSLLFVCGSGFNPLRTGKCRCKDGLLEPPLTCVTYPKDMRMADEYLEVSYRGSWKKVCLATHKDALCQKVGFNVAFYKDGYFAETYDIRCPENFQTLSNCSITSYGFCVYPVVCKS